MHLRIRPKLSFANRFRPRLSYSNVMSTIAVFVMLGGSSYAAVTLKKNSVGAKQISKNGVGSSEIAANAVGSSEVANNAVRSGDVLNGSLQLVDFAPNQLAAGAQGLQGLQGGKGDKGNQGDKGTAGRVGQARVQFEQSGTALANAAEVSIDAFCLAGEQGIAGGVRGDATNSELTKTTSSRPVISTGNTGGPVDGGTFTGWRGTVVNENNGTDIRPEVWVVCVPAPAP